MDQAFFDGLNAALSELERLFYNTPCVF